MADATDLKASEEFFSNDEFGIDSARASSTTADSSSIGDGELLLLMESLQEDDTAPLPENLEAAIQTELEEIRTKDDDDNAKVSPYGHPLSEEDAIAMMPPGEEGRIWYATIIPNEFIRNGKLLRGLNPRDYDIEQKMIKDRRPSLPVTQSDFFSSVTKVCEAGTLRPRYVFHGILNGWPSLRCLELISIEQKRASFIIPSPKEFVVGKIKRTKTWNTVEHGMRGITPQSCLDPSKVYRAKLRGAPWTEYGWSKEHLGFVFWYEPQRQDIPPRVLWGTKILNEISDKDSKCTQIHMISHRYAKERESPRDRITYHSVCLLEWDHGKYCTVTEAAYLNGMGGYRGRSNWYDDKDEPISSLYSVLPPEMILPWDMSTAEIRCYDVAAKNLEEFKLFVSKYAGNTKRFIDPQYSFSHPARITFRSRLHISHYMINYIMRDTQYAELKRNCQTYCADLCVLIAGKKNVQPFHPVSRIDYQNRTHQFLYDHFMYDAKKKQAKKK